MSQLRVSDREMRRKAYRRSESESPRRKGEEPSDMKDLYESETYEKCSDDNISEGSSDSEPEHQDLSEEYLNSLEMSLNQQTGSEKPILNVRENKKAKKDYSQLESMLTTNFKVEKPVARRSCIEEKLPSLNLTTKFQLASVCRESRKRDQVAYER
jgi:hypothetical protein